MIFLGAWEDISKTVEDISKGVEDISESVEDIFKSVGKKKYGVL
jgi:hypothetical protein